MTDVTPAEFIAHYRRHLLDLQDHCAKEEQIELPVAHFFSSGLYLRQIFMPAETFVIGKTHKTEHFNIVLSGDANVMIDGEIKRVTAPCFFKSGEGAKKTLWVLRDMIWITAHPTEETDLDTLEEKMVLSDKEERTLLEYELKKLEGQSCHGAR